MIKDSSLVSAIGLAELALAARTVAGAYSRYWEPYLLISAVYLVLTLVLSTPAKRLEAPAHLRGRGPRSTRWILFCRPASGSCAVIDAARQGKHC